MLPPIMVEKKRRNEMPTISSCIEIPIFPELKEPEEAVETFISKLKAISEFTPKTLINLHLMTQTDPTFIMKLAENSHEEATGFSIGPAGNKLSAKRFLELQQHGDNNISCQYDGCLTEHISAQEALLLLERLLELKPNIIGSTHFLIDISGLRWKGSIKSVSDNGMLCLSDMRMFNRKTKFPIGAYLLYHGESKDDPALESMFKSILEATGLDFKSGKISLQADIETYSNEKIPETFIQEVCTNEIFLETSKDIEKKGIKWQGLPHLGTHEEAFHKRAMAILDKNIKKEKINLDPKIKRFMKDNFPEYKLNEKDKYGFINFSRPTTEDFSTIITFEKEHYHGLGKAFTITLGTVRTSGSIKGWKTSNDIFKIWGDQLLRPSWAYSTGDELSEIFEGIKTLLNEVLPLFEKNMVKLLSPVPQEVPSHILQLGAITAKEGLVEANKVIKIIGDNFSLRHVGSGGSTTIRNMTERPCLKPDGRINFFGEWNFTYMSESEDGQGYLITVPAIGAVTATRIYDKPNMPVGYKLPSIRIPGNWLDSTEVMKIAEANGGKTHRENASSCFDIFLTLKRYASDRAYTWVERKSSDSVESMNRANKYFWFVHYGISVQHDQRRDFVIKFDCVDGSDILSGVEGS
jgi:hypothetical protein